MRSQLQDERLAIPHSRRKWSKFLVKVGAKLGLFVGEGAHLADHVLVELVSALAHDGIVDVVVERCPDLQHMNSARCQQSSRTTGTAKDMKECPMRGLASPPTSAGVD